MTSSRISLAALVAVALIACGGGGQGEGSGTPLDGTPGPEQPSYNDDAPPGNDDAPVDSYDSPPTSDQPGSNPDAPPGGGSTSALCSRLCTELAARQCDVGNPTTCASECTADLEGELGACLNEFVAFFDCLLANAFVCTADEQGNPGEPSFTEEDLAECESQAIAYVDCAGIDTEPEPQPEPGGECTPDDECASCVEVCDYCLCVTDNDTVTCETSCQ